MSHVEPIRVGRSQIEVVCEGFAPLPLHDECPGQDVDWDAERRAYPWAFHGGDAWAWHVHAFVVRGPSGVTLVDTGVGAFGPYAPWASTDPGAWDHLDPSEVGHVVLTHLHADHAGGATRDGQPRFRNATYHLHPGDWERFAEADDEQDYVARQALVTVQEAGALDLDPGDREVAPGISVRHTPGHTPGHRSVLVRDGDDTVLITGDVLHLPVQAAHPGWPSSHDEDPRIGAVSRRLILWRAANAGWRVVVNHFAVPSGRVGADGWQG